MIATLIRIFLGCFIAASITIFLAFLISLFSTFCHKRIVYGEIKELYGKRYNRCEGILYKVERYDNFVHISFDRLLKFYNMSPDKYEIEYSENYDGVCYLTRTVIQDSCHKEIYYFIMDTFSDFLKYQKFCENIERQRKQEEEQKEEYQSDFALGEYVKLVKADIAENEKQLNEKIKQLKEELQKQKDILKEK